MHDRSIRIATAADVDFVVSLQRAWSNALGFLPRCAHERYIDAGHVLIAMENGQNAGFVNFTVTPKGLVRIPQVAIHADLLRASIGSQLLRHLTIAARRGHCEAIRLTSRSDLAANLVWPTCGFHFTCLTRPASTRGYPLLEWTLPLYDPTEVALAFVTQARRSRTVRLLTPPAPAFDDRSPLSRG